MAAYAGGAAPSGAAHGRGDDARGGLLARGLPGGEESSRGLAGATERERGGEGAEKGGRLLTASGARPLLRMSAFIGVRPRLRGVRGVMPRMPRRERLARSSNCCLALNWMPSARRGCGRERPVVAKGRMLDAMLASSATASRSPSSQPPGERGESAVLLGEIGIGESAVLRRGEAICAVAGLPGRGEPRGDGGVCARTSNGGRAGGAEGLHLRHSGLKLHASSVVPQ